MKITGFLSELLIEDLAKVSGIAFKYRDRLTRDEAARVIAWAKTSPEIAAAITNKGSPHHQAVMLYKNMVDHYQGEHAQDRPAADRGRRPADDLGDDGHERRGGRRRHLDNEAVGSGQLGGEVSAARPAGGGGGRRLRGGFPGGFWLLDLHPLDRAQAVREPGFQVSVGGREEERGGGREAAKALVRGASDVCPYVYR